MSGCRKSSADGSRSMRDRPAAETNAPSREGLLKGIERPEAVALYVGDGLPTHARLRNKAREPMCCASRAAKIRPSLAELKASTQTSRQARDRKDKDRPGVELAKTNINNSKRLRLLKGRRLSIVVDRRASGDSSGLAKLCDVGKLPRSHLSKAGGKGSRLHAPAMRTVLPRHPACCGNEDGPRADTANDDAAKLGREKLRNETEKPTAAWSDTDTSKSAHDGP